MRQRKDETHQTEIILIRINCSAHLYMYCRVISINTFLALAFAWDSLMKIKTLLSLSCSVSSRAATVPAGPTEE